MTHFTRLLAAWLAALVLLLSGCSSQQLAKDEAFVNAELVKAEAAVTWATGHEPQILNALDTVLAVDPTNKTLQATVAKGKALMQSGAIDKAHAVLAGAIQVTTPVAGVTATTAAGP